MPQISSNTLTDSTEFLLLNEVAIIDQLAQAMAGGILAPDLNMSQFVVLNHLHRREKEASLVSMASAIQVTKGAMSNTVSKLQQKQLVHVKPAPTDGRGKLVSLTTRGQLVREAAVSRLADRLTGLEGALSKKEKDQMLNLLQKLRVWFDAERD